MGEKPETLDDNICEDHPKYQSQIKIESFIELDCGDQYTTSILIQNALEYGSNYRTQTKNSARKPLNPKNRPADVPFELCRAKQSGKKGKKKKKYCEDVCRPSTKPKKPTPLEKSIMSQEEYMSWLATPPNRYQKPPKKIKKLIKCEMSPCPPRFVQLAVPSKRRVLCTWNEFHNKLPVEMLLRFQDIMFANQNLELRDADYYYKKLEKKQKRSARKKKCLKLRKMLEKERGKYAWIGENINATVKAIMDFLKEEPLFSLNFKQLLLSDQILTSLSNKKMMEKPLRTTKDPCKKTIIEISDKLAVWMDTLTKFVDVQAVESEEDIPPITISSLESEEEEFEEQEEREEEEGEAEGEEEGEEEGKRIYVGVEEEILILEEDFEFGKVTEDEKYAEEGGEEGLIEGQMYGESKKEDGKEEELVSFPEDYMSGRFELGQAGHGEDQMGPGGVADGDLFNILNDLIKIYEERSPADYLANEIETVPGYTYFDILNKMKEITTEDKGPKKSKLEEAMIQWLTDVAPDQVNERTLKAIHEYACALLEQLKKQGYTDEDIDRFGLEAEGLGATTDEEMIAQPEAAPEGTITAHLPGTRGDIISSEPEEGVLGFIEPEEMFEDEMGEAEIIYEVEKRVSVEKLPEGLEGVIYGHKPAKVQEHSPDAICCLSLKIWAVWLLEVTHNAHMWTKWMHEIIKKVREFASIVRGDVKLPDGNKKVLYKSDWKKFVKETETKIIAWRQYSAHVKELSDSIIENFKNKKVFCCPKCLQDHLIKNVVAAHETLQVLTDAMNCAQYWRKCLDGLVQTTSSLTSLEERISSSEESSEAGEIVELSIEESSDSDDGDSFYELEEIQGRRYRKP